MKTSEFITKVLNNFKRYKWIKGRYSSPTASPNGGYCLLGMARKVGGKGNLCEIQKQQMYTLIHQVTGCGSIPVWNDRACRTRQDVIGALKVARELAVQKELSEQTST